MFLLGPSASATATAEGEEAALLLGLYTVLSAA